MLIDRHCVYWMIGRDLDGVEIWFKEEQVVWTAVVLILRE
jgi:hypothetical protein